LEGEISSIVQSHCGSGGGTGRSQISSSRFYRGDQLIWGTYGGHFDGVSWYE
jgi:hypothetical protein